MNKYSLFIDKWSGGCGSQICQGARKVFARGKIPCDILFVGEAPGESEDTLGVPFVGPAGKLLDSIIERAIGDLASSAIGDRNLRLAFTNTVCCIPRYPWTEGGKADEPENGDIKQCRPRLVEFVRMARPRMIVLAGRVAKEAIQGQSMFNPVDWLPQGQEFIEFVEIIHPAAILKGNQAQKGLNIQRSIVVLRTAVDSLFFKE